MTEPESASAAPQAPAAGESARPWWALESPALTVGFWGACLVLAGAFWAVRFPPCVDYPQHVALGAILGRLLDASAPEHELYEISWVSYNGLFHLLVALGSRVVSAEAAGRFLLGALPLVSGASWLALLRWAGRPRWYAFALLPLGYSHTVGWGFVNYSLGVPLALGVLVAWLHARDGRPRLDGLVVAGSLLLAYTHVLALMGLGLCLVVATVARARPDRGWLAWLTGLGRGALPLVPAGVYAALAYRAHRSAPNLFWENLDGTDLPAWEKLRDAGLYTVGNFGDGTDVRLFWGVVAAVALLFLAPWLGGAEVGARRPATTALAVVWGLAYVLVPRVWMSTWFLFERVPAWALPFALAAAPVVGRRLAAWVRPALVVLGVGSALNVARVFSRLQGQEDASAILDDIPEGSRVFAVMHGQTFTPAVWRHAFVHHAAYYVARRPGELAYSFTLFAALPVRYRAAKAPPRLEPGLEWRPWDYDVVSEAARLRPIVLVRTPDLAPDEDPAARTFGAWAPAVRLLSRRGRFWLYDTRDVGAAGAPGALPGAAPADERPPEAADAAEVPPIKRR
ncbi:MAG: hypothetical protein IT376_14890 [Polyangiaceae bacterium]|nr:hypothetical protein [Polyangiaceae bacterium]